MLNIKVLGSGCANCINLEKLCREVVSENRIEAEIEKVTDYKDKFLEEMSKLYEGQMLNSV